MAVADPAGAVDLERLDRGLDALELHRPPVVPRWRRAATVTVPKVVAILVVLGVWEVAVLLHWQPTYVLPSPGEVFGDLAAEARAGHVTEAVLTSLRRAALGFGLSLVVGTPLGLLIARVRAVRLALGSLVAGLQSLPSVTWVPLGIVAFGLNETTITFVVVMGAVPSIAQGLVSAVDGMPPLLLRVGRSMGARGPSLYRHIVLPAVLPGYIAGLKQAWSFSWRSLMAAELITQSPDLGLGLGRLLDDARSLSDMGLVVMSILVILVVGIGVDALVFAPLERGVLRRRGLAPAGSGPL